MFTWAEISPTDKHDIPNYHLFRTWWDVAMDYLVVGTVILIFLLFFRMNSMEAGGLLCVSQNSSAFGWIESKYINSRCCQNSAAAVIIFSPYLMFLIWMMLSLSHSGWLRLPFVSSKLALMGHLLTEMYKVRPKFYRSPQTFKMIETLHYDSKSQEAIDHSLNRLTFLLTEGSIILPFYTAKLALTALSCITALTLGGVVLGTLKSLRHNFECKLDGASEAFREFPDVVCHLNTASFYYVVLIIYMGFHLSLLFTSLRGLLWVFSVKGYTADKEPIADVGEYVSGLPGYPDMLLCISLLKENVHDGHVMYEAVCSCVKTFFKKHFCSSYRRRKNPVEAAPVSMSAEVQENINLIRWITNHLGLEEVPNVQDSEHLFNCLVFIQDSLGRINLDVTRSMRDRIVDELEFYPLLYKPEVDDDDSTVSFEQFCANMRSIDTYGSLHLLPAAASLLNVRIVLIHCRPDIRLKEVYCPSRQITKAGPESLVTKFLTFVPPHFFCATRDAQVTSDWPYILNRRIRYSRDQANYRVETRTNAVRHVNSFLPCVQQKPFERVCDLVC